MAHQLAVAAALTALGWLVCGPSVAQVTRARDIALVEGRGELLQFHDDVSKVVIAEPKVADTIVVSPREIMVTAKSPGRTTLVVWENGSEPARYEIEVTKDNSEWENFRKEILASAAGSPVAVTGAGETIVLSGSVPSVEISKRLAGMAQTRAKTVINLLQTPPVAEPRQILLQVKFAAVSRVALTTVGFNLFSTNSVMQGGLSTEQFAAPRFSPVTTGGGSPSTTVNFTDLLNLFAFRPDIDLGATIKALEEQDLLEILAEPNLIALDGKDASFLAGGSFPFPTITTTPTGGSTAPVITVQFKPFGVKLDFTPNITPDGAIDLKVTPEVSSLDYANAVTLQGYTIPALAQRRAETEVMLRDGQSFAIAGLINNQVIQTVSKILILGDIPILGQLFRSRSTQKSRDDLLVVITPHLIKPLSPEDKAAMPTMPVTFLPAARPPAEKKKGKKATKPSAATTPNQPEFVGPRGPQIPKQ
jgi:pilus assembly protein CpaC